MSHLLHTSAIRMKFVKQHPVYPVNDESNSSLLRKLGQPRVVSCIRWSSPQSSWYRNLCTPWSFQSVDCDLLVLVLDVTVTQLCQRAFSVSYIILSRVYFSAMTDDAGNNLDDYKSSTESWNWYGYPPYPYYPYGSMTPPLWTAQVPGASASATVSGIIRKLFKPHLSLLPPPPLSLPKYSYFYRSILIVS